MSMAEGESLQSAPVKAQDVDGGQSGGNYNRLRSWYLATLRKRIIDRIDAQSLTPAALIRADRQAVYRLIAQAAEQPPASAVAGAAASTNSGRQLTLLLVWLPALTQLPLLLLLAYYRQLVPGPAWWLLLGASLLMSVIGALAVKVVMGQSMRRSVEAANARLGQIAADYPEFRLRLESKGNPQGVDTIVEQLSAMLLQAIQREQAIADYALDFFCTVNSDYQFAAVSPDSLKFCSYPPPELIGKKFRDFLVADDIQRCEKFLSAMRVSSSSAPFECRFKCKDGSAMDVVWHMEWSETESAFYCTGKDVSDQRQLERLREEFVAMVGHDLKTPITAVDCTLEILSEELSEKGKKLAQGGRDSIARLLKLINELLDLERMESGQLPVSKQSVQLDAVVTLAVEAVESYANRQRLSIHQAPAELAIVADGERIHQVLVNLLSNAIKFSPDGGTISVHARLLPERRPGLVLVTVADCGPGIAEEYQDRIFERFQQVTETDKKRGSGLGLSICKAIVQAHGGAIGVESQPGQGSRFWFTVPVDGD